VHLRGILAGRVPGRRGCRPHRGSGGGAHRRVEAVRVRPGDGDVWLRSRRGRRHRIAPGRFRAALRGKRIAKPGRNLLARPRLVALGRRLEAVADAAAEHERAALRARGEAGEHVAHGCSRAR
jgi:hypothetical protein